VDRDGPSSDAAPSLGLDLSTNDPAIGAQRVSLRSGDDTILLSHERLHVDMAQSRLRRTWTARQPSYL